MQAQRRAFDEHGEILAQTKHKEAAHYQALYNAHNGIAMQYGRAGMLFAPYVIVRDMCSPHNRFK